MQAEKSAAASENLGSHSLSDLAMASWPRDIFHRFISVAGTYACMDTGRSSSSLFHVRRANKSWTSIERGLVSVDPRPQCAIERDQGGLHGQDRKEQPQLQRQFRFFSQ